MYIEPCCADQQLPKLLKDCGGGPVMFQTNGDVTIGKFLSAVSYMVDTPQGGDMTIVIGEVNVALLRLMREWFKKGWLRSLTLLTTADQSELISTELADYMDRVTAVHDPLVIDHLLIFAGEKRTLLLQGALLTEVDFSLSLYTAYVGSDESIISSATDAVRAKVVVKARK